MFVVRHRFHSLIFWSGLDDIGHKTTESIVALLDFEFSEGFSLKPPNLMMPMLRCTNRVSSAELNRREIRSLLRAVALHHDSCSRATGGETAKLNS